MKRKDITPGEVYSLVSYRDSRQGWPFMILSADSYSLDWRTKVLDHAGTARLVQGDYHKSAVGLLAVRLAFSMHTPQGEDGDGPLMDVLEFRAKVAELSDLADIPQAIAAINASGDKAWDDREHLHIRNAEGELLGTYELLTGLLMVQGLYIPLTLAERERERIVAKHADEAERQRVANVETAQGLSARLTALGITGYHVARWESPTRFPGLSFEDMDALVCLAEAGWRSDVEGRKLG